MDVAAAGMEMGRGDGEFLAVHLPFFKATPHTEGDERFIFCEASNESGDQEHESILKSALEGSARFFQENGNVDVDHLTILGYRVGIRNPHLYEIGRPAEVRFAGPSSLVKARLYRGDTPAAEMANYVWSTFHLEPPMRWYPSVGGDKLARQKVKDPVTGLHKSVVTDVLWKNMALSKQPQNLSVPAVSVLGFEEFAKGLLLAKSHACAEDEPCTETCCKAVTALPSPTDVGARTGGAALTGQSLAGSAHAGRYERAAALYLQGAGTHACPHTAVLSPTRATLEDHFQTCGDMDHAEARAAAQRFLHDVAQRTTRQAA